MNREIKGGAWYHAVLTFWAGDGTHYEVKLAPRRHLTTDLRRKGRYTLCGARKGEGQFCYWHEVTTELRPRGRLKRWWYGVRGAWR